MSEGCVVCFDIILCCKTNKTRLEMAAWRSFAAVILIQAISAGLILLSKAVFNGGMSNYVFIFYRQAAAAVFLAPFAFFFEWKKASRLDFTTFCKILGISVFRISVALNLNALALVYTTSTFAAASANCFPIITFALSVLFRMEVLNLKSVPGFAKMTGMLLTVGGALVLAFYSGRHWILFQHPLFSDKESTYNKGKSIISGSRWIEGCLIMFLSMVLGGVWIILQLPLLKIYPFRLIFTTLQCFLSSFGAFAIAICMERDFGQWRLGWNLKLLVIAYSGVLVTGFVYYLQTWVIMDKGPVFLSTWTPLSFIITAILSPFLLGEAISMESIIGGSLLAGGLYTFLYGRSIDKKADLARKTEALTHKLGLAETILLM